MSIPLTLGLYRYVYALHPFETVFVKNSWGEASGDENDQGLGQVKAERLELLLKSNGRVKIENWCLCMMRINFVSLRLSNPDPFSNLYRARLIFGVTGG